MKKKILVAFGTRPEVIKMAPVVRALRRVSSFDVKVANIGQHRELVDDLLEPFGLKPDFNLRVMRKNQSLAHLLSRTPKAATDLLSRVRPDWVLVQGDTMSVFLMALSAFCQRIRVGHIEAGLRSYDRFNPYPEEAVRTMVSRITDLHFAPTKGAARNLVEEGIPARDIVVTGNPVIDSLAWAVRQSLTVDARKLLYPFGPRPFALLTMHRRETFGRPMEEALLAIRKLSDQLSLPVLFPVHPNPNVRKVVRKVLRSAKNIIQTEPVDYFTFCHLLNQCRFVLTDSGGLQEEAPFLGKPVLVLREVTERTESIDAGAGLLVGTDSKKILHYGRLLMQNSALYKKMARKRHLFGDGHAAEKVAKILIKNSRA